jgi:mannose-6-phosphate isomerase
LVAESWEISAHPEGMGVVADGPLRGKTLAEVTSEFGSDLTGPGLAAFPLLVKVLDARENLSLQVHPDDQGARRFGGEAKTEMWHVLDADEGAHIFAGFKGGVGPDDFRLALKHGRIRDVMQMIPAKAGDTLFIPGGRVHAIGAGIRILEVQQSSNTTYRLFDWGRVGPDGKPRDVHLEKAWPVIDWNNPRGTRVLPGLIQERTDLRRWVLLECPYFRMEKIEVSGVWKPMERGPSFDILFVIQGALRVENPAGMVEVPAGTSVLLPAQPRDYGVNTLGKPAVILRVTVPTSKF